MTGPYETPREAMAAVQHITSSPPGSGAWRDGSLRLLEDACRAAGVRLGAYDDDVMVWLSGLEPWTCAVIAGLITRAALTGAQRATVLDALDVAAEYRQYRASLTCEECAREPGGLCAGRAADLDRADEYGAVAEALQGQP
jgi:hypothetical protein